MDFGKQTTDVEKRAKLRASSNKTPNESFIWVKWDLHSGISESEATSRPSGLLDAGVIRAEHGNFQPGLEVARLGKKRIELLRKHKTEEKSVSTLLTTSMTDYKMEEHNWKTTPSAKD